MRAVIDWDTLLPFTKRSHDIEQNYCEVYDGNKKNTKLSVFVGKNIYFCTL